MYYALPMRWLRTLYLTNGAIYGVSGAFGAVVLTWHGFDPSLVATTASLGSLVFWFALPIWGHLGDAVVGTRRALQIAAIPAAIFTFCLVLPAPAALVVFFALGGSATGGAISALTDAEAVSGLADPRRDYGRLRMLGSLSAGLVALGAGLLYDHSGYFLAPVLGAVATISVVVCAGRLPSGKCDSVADAPAAPPAETCPEIEAPRHDRFGSVSDALHGRPRLIAILIGCLGIFIGIMGSGTFVTLKLQALGGGPSMIGLANGIGAVAEVPGMIVAGWLSGRFGIRPVLGACGFGFVAVMCTWALVTEPMAIVATKVVAGLCFAGVTVGFVVTMATILPSRLVSTGQTLYQSVAFGGGSILANMAGAVIFRVGGFGGVFWFLALAALTGSVIVLLAVPGHSQAGAVETDTAPLEALPVAGA
jgi:MFS transporter, PPP family, 3-phenylpropionic acid transporter